VYGAGLEDEFGLVLKAYVSEVLVYIIFVWYGNYVLVCCEFAAN
jgi:hypothetical protein